MNKLIYNIGHRPQTKDKENVMTTNNARCLKNHGHIWDTEYEYDTHIVKQCVRCKTKNWRARKGSSGSEARPTPDPIRTAPAYFD